MIKLRLKVIYFTLLAFFALGFSRFFVWQVLPSFSRRSKPLLQNYQITEILPLPGQILSADSFPISLPQTKYQLSIYKPDLKEKIDTLLNRLEKNKPGFSAAYLQSLANPDQKWITVQNILFDPGEVATLNLPGLNFEPVSYRLHPDSTLNSLPLLSLERYYSRQLTGKSGFLFTPKDAVNQPLLSKKTWQILPVNGQNITTSLCRPCQFVVDQALRRGLDNYQAESALAILLQPQTGAILAFSDLSATPAASLFEPGSIFKPIVMTMALDSQKISPDYRCHQCHRPRTIGPDTITNWDQSVYPDSDLKNIIKNSDNIGMSYIIDQLGLDQFLSYFSRLSLDRKTGVDLSPEAKPLTKKSWPAIDFATASFGQGFAITPLQMAAAFNTLANNGFYLAPHFNSSPTKTNRHQVFKTSSLNTIADILRYATENGVVNQFRPPSLEVCGKSGTAQIAVNGKYSENQSYASYVGFSPCRQPLFTLLVSFKNPKTSPWGSSTAAPIWFEIAQKISHLLY